jgi:DNA-binding CsgD family transcriptional regulator
MPSDEANNHEAFEALASATSPGTASVGGEAVWAMLTHEPNTGVGIVTRDGLITYLNDQAARIFHGPEATASSFIGRRWSDHMPPDWVEERLAVLATVSLSGVPALMRTIWRGFQHFSWIYPVSREPGSREAEASEGVSTFLILTRRAQHDAEAEALAPANEYRWVDSKVATFGKLDVLSERELEVLALLGQGLSIDDAAKVLFRSPETIKSHRKSIGEKLGVTDRLQLAKIVGRAGLRLEDAQRERLVVRPMDSQ